MATKIDLPNWLIGDYLGAEAGFNERADVIQALDGTDLNAFWNEIQETVRLRNQDRSRLIDQLTVRVTGPVDSVTVPSEAEFEEASEYGQPVGIRAQATRLYRGYDFKFYDLAIRYTWMYIAEADARQLRLLNNMALEADTKLIFQRVMRTLFDPLNKQGIAEANEPITVYKFYNGDGETPPAYKHNTFEAGHNHYVTSGGATVTPANLDTLANLVGEHGYTLQNGYRLVLWVNKQEADVIRGFRTATGATFDFVPNAIGANGAVWVPNDGQYVGGPNGTVQGQIGTYGPFHVVEEAYIPAGYAVAVVTGGPENLQNPIGLREHSNPAYRGLKLIPGQRSDYPLVDSFYRRGIGTGIRQRGGGAIMQITANPTYTIPAAYAG
jgi:hypothetical protein